MKTNFLIFCFLSVFFTNCKHKTEQKDDCCKKPETATNTAQKAISDASIFDIESTWKTQDDKPIKLAELKGKTLVMAMIFTHCQSACPRIISDLQRIESAIPKAQLPKVQFVLVSMDPNRDTPKRLKEFAAEHQLDESRWTLLTSNENDALEFANAIGVKYKKTNEGGFDHSNIIHIIDKNGVIIYQQVGLEQEPRESIEKIIALNEK